MKLNLTYRLATEQYCYFEATISEAESIQEAAELIDQAKELLDAKYKPVKKPTEAQLKYLRSFDQEFLLPALKEVGITKIPEATCEQVSKAIDAAKRLKTFTGENDG